MTSSHEIHHISILVADTERALKFYRDVLQWEILENRPDLGYPGAWLKLGSQQVHLLELPNPTAVNNPPTHGGRDRHVAVAVNDLAPLQAALTRAGVTYTLSRSGRNALFCRDPDGNAWEFIGGST